MMKFCLFVHDFHKEIGHSRALVESINCLNEIQKKNIEEIRIVAFTCSNVHDLFVSDVKNVRFIKVPFPNIKPFIFKMFFYHVYTFLYSVLIPSDFIKVGIGIACLNVDLSNIQFLHGQWENYFFKIEKLNIIRLIYKKILFLYFRLGEFYLYRLKNPKMTVLANFMKHYMQNVMKIKGDIEVAYSGVNFNEFKMSDQSSVEIYHLLLKDYPQLSVINISKPVYIFIGAFERKGFYRVLEFLKFKDDAQLIAIGRAVDLEKIKSCLPEKLKFCHIPFTKKVSLFYQISDCFIFPTLYEPFGLVILEAYAMGLDIIVPKENVGASEIIEKQDGVNFILSHENILYEIKKLEQSEKQKRIEHRKMNLRNFTWESNAQIQYGKLFSGKNDQ